MVISLLSSLDVWLEVVLILRELFFQDFLVEDMRGSLEEKSFLVVEACTFVQFAQRMLPEKVLIFHRSVQVVQ